MPETRLVLWDNDGKPYLHCLVASFHDDTIEFLGGQKPITLLDSTTKDKIMVIPLEDAKRLSAWVAEWTTPKAPASSTGTAAQTPGPGAGVVSAVRFAVPGTPTPKGRPRLGSHGVYTPERTRSAEEAMGWAARQACPEPLEGPLQLEVTFWFALPKRQRKGTPWVQECSPHIGRPDLDNCVKTVMDACNGIVWGDDAQVFSVQASKRYGAEAGTEVTIREAP